MTAPQPSTPPPCPPATTTPPPCARTTTPPASKGYPQPRARQGRSHPAQAEERGRMRLYQALQAASRDARLQSAGLQSSYSAPSRCTHW